MYLCQFVVNSAAKTHGQRQTRSTPITTTPIRFMLGLLLFQIIVITSSNCASPDDRVEQQVAESHKTAGAATSSRLPARMLSAIRYGDIGSDDTSGSKFEHLKHRSGLGKHVTRWMTATADKLKYLRPNEFSDASPAVIFRGEKNFRQDFPSEAVAITKQNAAWDHAASLVLGQEEALSSNEREFQKHQPDGIIAETALVAARRDQPIKASGHVPGSGGPGSRPVFNPTGW